MKQEKTDFNQTHNFILQVSPDLVNLFGRQEKPPSLLQRLDQTHHPGLHRRLPTGDRLLDLRLLRDGGHLRLELPDLLVPLLHLSLHGLREDQGEVSRVELSAWDKAGERELWRREGWNKVDKRLKEGRFGWRSLRKKTIHWRTE